MNSQEGLVVKSTGSWYDVRSGSGNIYHCKARGKFRISGLKTTNPVAVGDRVIFRVVDDNAAEGVIEKIIQRKNYIVRQAPHQHNVRHIIAANIDNAFLICTVAKPRTSAGFIDRFLLNAEMYGVPATLLFNKQDILTEEEKSYQQQLIQLYRAIGYPVYPIIAKQRDTLQPLIDIMKDRITLLTGHSGAGKSTLINTLNPELNIKTAPISTYHKKGVHTTTFAAMYDLPFGGQIIDTPGIKEFGIVDLALAEVSHYFPEFRELLSQCKFNDCLHINEPDCAILNALEEGLIAQSRYKSYLSIIEELRSRKPY